MPNPNSTCSHCQKTKDIIFTFEQQQTKEVVRTLMLCPQCTSKLLTLIMIFNTELPNKVFNYIEKFPS